MSDNIMNDTRKPILPKESPRRNIKRIKKILISFMMRLLWYIRYSQRKACTQKPTDSLTVPTLVYIHFYINIRFFFLFTKGNMVISNTNTPKLLLHFPPSESETNSEELKLSQSKWYRKCHEHFNSLKWPDTC